MLPNNDARLFIERARSVRVLVAGDCMLDVYVSGSASRISPEAPVPVVNVTRCRYLPGGAANVAANAQAFGASVILAGLTGGDQSAERLRGELGGLGISTAALVVDQTRRTTTKTRITAAGQQIARFDEEDIACPLPGVAGELMSKCESALREVDVCVISDYAKGVVTPAFARRLIERAGALRIPVVVDPKARDLAIYRGATVITPNLKEALDAAGPGAEDNEAVSRPAQLLLEKIAPSALLITRGEHGMSLFEPNCPEVYLPALVNEVADVTGAGDTVVSALAIALGCGFGLPTAASIANIAAGIAVSHHGTWAVQAAELARSINELPSSEA